MGLYALAGYHLDPLETGGGVEALQPTLETEAVADQQFGVSQGADILRRWLIDVSITIGPHQHRDADLVATDLLYQIAGNAEGGGNRHFGQGQWADGEPQNQQGRADQFHV